jgi:hypothetical protein
LGELTRMKPFSSHHVAGVGWHSVATSHQVQPGWWQRHRAEVARDVVIAVLVLTAGFYWDDRLTDRSESTADRLASNAEVLENTRFVRSLSSLHQPRPFNGIVLDGAALSGLDLSCDPTTPRTCAQFEHASLRGVDLSSSRLSGADFFEADLSEAFLVDTDLTDTSMRDADLSDAIIEFAILRRTNLAYANLLNVTLHLSDPALQT